MQTPQREAGLFEYLEDKAFVEQKANVTVLAAPELLLREPVFRCK
jgi:hypothetical protein